MPAGIKSDLELLRDIVNGWTAYNSKFGPLYFKHLDVFSYEENVNFYLETYEKLKISGILSEKDQISNAIDNELWSDEKDKSISSLKYSIKRMLETKKKLIYEIDKDNVSNQIKNQIAELKELEKERGKCLSLTAENMATERAVDYYIKNHIYRDKMFSEKIFENEESFEYVEVKDIQIITFFYIKFINKTDLKNVKKLALCPYFQNLLIASNRPMDIFGKPIFALTKIQTDLLIWGNYFKIVKENLLETVPDGLEEDPEKFMDWVVSLKEKNKQKNKQKNKNKGKDGSSKFVFGSNNDVQKITGEKNISGNKIIQESLDRGGLSMQELMDK